MSIEIVAPSDRMSQILSDLSKRRATILNVESKGEFNKVSEMQKLRAAVRIFFV